MSQKEEVECSTGASAATHAKELNESRENTLVTDYPDEWYPKAVVRSEAESDDLQSFGVAEEEVNIEDEDLMQKCIEIMRQEKTASTSLFQRRLRLGYTKAAHIVERYGGISLKPLIEYSNVCCR